MNEKICPFCALVVQKQYENESTLSVSFKDKYPVSPGHTLIIPKRHETDFSLLTQEEQTDIWDLANKAINEIKNTLNPAGFNIGVNINEAAGQTVGHAHMHVIPRYEGDMADPRGGIRYVIPDKADYWSRE